MSSSARAAVLDRLAELILQVRRPHPVRVAIDGYSTAGKTTLADDLAPILARTRPVIRASLDNFLRPPAQRQDYYRDSFDHPAIRASLLEPLGPNGNRHYRVSPTDPGRRADHNAILLADGIFLLRPELADQWDFRIFVDVPADLVLARGVARDQDRLGGAEPARQRYLSRYLPGETLYLDTVRPAELADAVLDNTDPDSPVLTKERLRHNAGNAATGGIWRVPEGIRKVARPPRTDGTVVGLPSWQTSDEPTHWNYWRREALAYRTGLAAEAYAEAGIIAPSLLDYSEQHDGSVVLLLAEATGAPAIRWPVERLAHFAYQLGAGQARYADRVPDLPWLSRRWLAQYLSGRQVWVPDEPDWSHPLAAIWPDHVGPRLNALWHRRDEALRRAEAGPHTLCHLDVWPMNLFEAGDRTVLIDWSFVGEGSLGEDPANLIIDSVTDGLIDAALLPQINESVTDGYLAGLRDGGWTGPADDVRAAIRAAAVTKYSWFGMAVMGRAIREGTTGHANYGTGDPVEAELLRLRGLVTLLADWAEAVLR